MNEPVETYKDSIPYWIKGFLDTEAGKIPVVETRLNINDRIGSWKVRWNINRMNYKILPGIYAAGNPGSTSPVLVTANYKLTFDMLRKELNHTDAWIMVLDTDGVNVWCAAGKGTFGTAELIKRIKLSGLEKIISHKKIILPQLGASGVAFHTVLKHTGFRVIYGPILSKDIPEFINSGMKANEAMRRVQFPLKNRMVLAPVEIVGSFKILIPLFLILLLVNMFNIKSYNFTAILTKTLMNFLPLLGAAISGCLIVPAFLPYIPFHAFSLKGLLPGAAWAVFVILNSSVFQITGGFLIKFSYFIFITVISSYLSLNFTGSTTFTSLSGVKKEMEKSIPIMAVASAAGLISFIAGEILELSRLVG